VSGRYANLRCLLQVHDYHRAEIGKRLLRYVTARASRPSVEFFDTSLASASPSVTSTAEDHLVVSSLGQHVRRNECRRAVPSDNNYLGRASDHVDINGAEHQPLGGCYIYIAGPTILSTFGMVFVP
jgi:hypothetical protein